jgi:hypothetical protein
VIHIFDDKTWDHDLKPAMMEKHGSGALALSTISMISFGSNNLGYYSEKSTEGLDWVYFQEIISRSKTWPI